MLALRRPDQLVERTELADCHEQLAVPHPDVSRKLPFAVGNGELRGGDLAVGHGGPTTSSE
jgi:hypothetical protein